MAVAGESRSGRRRIITPLEDFLRTEVAGGVVLVVAAVAALAWANIWPDGYEEFWGIEVRLISVGGFEASADLRKLVVDGLMAIFFFVVGMEIKRELVVGELAERRVAALGVFAAIGGMGVPALIFVLINLGDPDALRGWGIPMATDIAFALGALSLLRRWIPTQLAAFLLAVAVVDDIGAITVIALFYSGGIEVVWIGVAAAGLIVVAAMVRAHVHSWIPYAAVGVVVWSAAYQSGVHATIAGVALGLLMPVFAKRSHAEASAEAVRTASAIGDGEGGRGASIAAWERLHTLGRDATPLLERFEHAIHPWSSFVILPLFALSSAGVVIRGDTLSEAAGSTLVLGVAAGLVLGNTIGIPLGAWIAIRLGLARLPEGVEWPHIIGAAALAGIGFTVSLFVATLAFDDPALVDQAKLAIVGASLVAGATGASILRLYGARRARV